MSFYNYNTANITQLNPLKQVVAGVAQLVEQRIRNGVAPLYESTTYNSGAKLGLVIGQKKSRHKGRAMRRRITDFRLGQAFVSSLPIVQGPAAAMLISLRP